MGNNIKELALQYRVRLDRINSRRTEWQSNTKNLIKDALDTITSEDILTWFVQVNDQTPNWESVVLCLENQGSGIRFRTESGERHLIRNGGSLAFSQSADGIIIVWMEYPFVEELETPRGNHILARVEPESINPEVINDYVETFLNHLVESDGQSNAKLGFDLDSLANQTQPGE